MKHQPDQATSPALLYSFTVASADMFYSEVCQRDIYVRDDPETGFHIWGEVAGAGVGTAADLGQILLEYAMSVTAKDLPCAYRQIDDFGKGLGEKLAVRIMQCMPADNSVSRAACALECLFEALEVQFVTEQNGEELCYTLDHCPLCEKARRIGLSQVEVAHHGLNALCHSLVHALDPGLKVRLPRTPRADRVFTLTLDQGRLQPVVFRN